jgi:hypothetical protein
MRLFIPNIFSNLLMNAKQLLLSLSALSTLMLGGTRQAFAQEDESWYKHRPKAQHQEQMPRSPISSKGQKQVTTNQRTVCDFVANGDMETQLAIPSHTGNMGGGGRRDAPPAYLNAPDQLADWYSPTLGTPDFLATNAANTIQGNDVNPNLETRIDGAATVSGSSSVRSGIGEIGLYSRQAPTNDPLANVSEYATTKITPTLPNVSYYAEMWVSLSHSTLSCNYGIDTDFGMWFTPNDNFKQLENRLYLKSNSSPIAEGDINNGILGPTNWKRISGILRGNGENYVTIGAFNPILNRQPLQGKNGNIPNTYVFVDDFQLYKIPTAGSAKSTCSGSSITLGEGCPIPGATYTWSAPGITGLPINSSNINTTVSPTATTTYTLTVTLPDQTKSTTTATVSVSYPAQPAGASFYTSRYVGCRRYNNVIMPALPGATRYIAYVGVGGNTAEGSAEGTVNSSGYVIFPVDIEGANREVTAIITVFSGACTRQLTFTQTLEGPDPYCGYPGDGQTSIIATSYPNPANESFTVPTDAEEATLFDGRGREVQKASKLGKVDVRNLPEGLYNLKTLQKGKVINQRIQVKHR